MNWTEFFTMGGYGQYIWWSYGLAALILILNLYLPLRRRTIVRRQLREFFRLKRSSQTFSE